MLYFKPEAAIHMTEMTTYDWSPRLLYSFCFSFPLSLFILIIRALRRIHNLHHFQPRLFFFKAPEIAARLRRVTHAQESGTGNLYQKFAQAVSRKFLQRVSRFPAQVFWYQIPECVTAIMKSIYGPVSGTCVTGLTQVRCWLICIHRRALSNSNLSTSRLQQSGLRRSLLVTCTDRSASITGFHPSPSPAERATERMNQCFI